MRATFFSVLILLILGQGNALAWHDYNGLGDWDYHGSGRDHAYSAYIDRYYYGEYDNAAPINTDYINGPLVFNAAATAPAIRPVGSPIIAQVPSYPVVDPNEFTVNIPNEHGGYNAVVIKRSGNGFVGPQGEFYPEFPKRFQLQMKYGR